MKPVAHALVVGGSSGIGAAIARALLQRGSRVSVLARRPWAGEAAVTSHTCDVTDSASVERAVADATRGAPCDLVVYAAGAPAMGRTLDVPEAAARLAFEVNYWGLERVVRSTVPGMVEHGQGAVLAVLSIAALRPVPYEAHYAASKAAAARYLACLGHEVEPSGVRVRWICPGYVDTGFAERTPWHGMPTPRITGSGIEPDDVALAALGLLDAHRRSDTLGWRERAIVLSDRLAPGLYDRWLAHRARP